MHGTGKSIRDRAASITVDGLDALQALLMYIKLAATSCQPLNSVNSVVTVISCCAEIRNAIFVYTVLYIHSQLVLYA